MGRNRKKGNEGLPKGVYKYSTKKGKVRYKASIYTATDVPQTHLGPFDTPEEAEYKRTVAMHGNHWGIDESMDGAFGFIYKVTERSTGRMYIGKKQMYYWDGPVGGYKCTDPHDSVWWDAKAWRSGCWEMYTTSSEEINELVANGNPWDFKWECIVGCINKLTLHKAEVSFQEYYNVLEETMDDGSYLYFNKNIAGLEFRPPFRRADVLEAQVRTAEDARNYYLKPDLDGEGRVVPFGAKREVVAPYKPSTAGDFDDVR